MQTRWLIPTVLVLLFAACDSEMTDTPGQQQPDAGFVCQDGINCCKPEEMVCTGDPDGNMVCRCHRAWDCDKDLDPSKCWQNPADTPDGATDWDCSVDGEFEKCSKKGGEVPPGGAGWSCQKSGDQIVCERPVNEPDGGGAWDCTYEEMKKTCVKVELKPDGSAPPQDAGVPDTGAGKDGNVAPPDQTIIADQGSGWTCTTDSNGVTTCTKTGAGIPPGGSGGPTGQGDFKCYRKDNKIICEGSSSTPPGGGGWTCVKNDAVGGWRCTKPVEPSDVPPGGGDYTCRSGTNLGGTECTKPPPTQPGQECVPNDKMWCDGRTYCGWGLVECGPDGKWKRTMNSKTGKMELDCWEPSSGIVPNTVCACYFTYYNKDCCERPDCILPKNTNGQICPASAGQYCDYCSPLKPNCKETGAKCIVTTNHETFCGKDCSGGKACPAGNLCLKLTVSGQSVMQCVPTDLSCYY